MSTPDDEYWVVDHRIVWDNFLDEEELLNDPQTLLGQRALEIAYPQLRIAGTVYNELRIGRDELEGAAPSPEPAGEDIRDHSKGARHLNFRRVASAIESKYVDDGSDHVIQREGNDYIRRTYITRSRATLEPISRQMATDALLVRDTDIEIYPDPSPEKCAACLFVVPCRMLDAGRSTSRTTWPTTSGCAPTRSSTRRGCGSHPAARPSGRRSAASRSGCTTRPSGAGERNSLASEHAPAGRLDGLDAPAAEARPARPR